MVRKLSRSSSAAVSDFRYDACDEHICLATNLPGLAPGRLAEPGAVEDSRVFAGGEPCLKAQLGQRLRLSDKQRRRLAANWYLSLSSSRFTLNPRLVPRSALIARIRRAMLSCFVPGRVGWRGRYR